MRATRRSVLLFACIGAAVIAVGAVSTGAWLVRSHWQSVAVSASDADAEFAQLRSRFSYQPALLDMVTRTADARATRLPGRSQLRVFHTVIFDRRGGDRLIRISVPYWLAKRYASHSGAFAWLGELTFLDDTEFDPEPIRLSLAQLEARGPGLVADYRHPSGGQFISWVE